jgi:hypothetical protein
MTAIKPRFRGYYLSDELEVYLRLIKRYKHKAHLLRQIHSDLYIKYQRRSNLLNAASIILATIITIISVANVTNLINFLNNYFSIHVDTNFTNSVFSGSITFFAFIVLFISLADLLLDWRNKYTSHESGVRLLTGFITSVNEMEEMIENKSIDVEQIKIQIEEIKNRYILIGEMLPLLPDQDFINSKQKYIIKRSISEKLEKDPCIDIDLKKAIEDCKKRSKSKTISNEFK